MYSAVSNLPNVKHTPPAVLFLGLYCGAMPFFLLPVLIAAVQSYAKILIYANLSYGAIILAYLGAVRWAFALPETKDKKMEPTFLNMGLAVSPSCIAWAALLLDGSAGFLLLVGTFTLILLQDLYSDIYPPWYKSFRIILIGIALLSLLTTLIMSRFIC